jgi:CDGSH iron-sulfur domain-containing protein 3
MVKMENDITLFEVLAGGPLKVTGPFRIKGPDGKVIRSDGPVYLCRCGHSSNKPFCDKTHKWIGFSD